jgi:hypothetical protein
MNPRAHRAIVSAERNQATRSGTFVLMLWRLKVIATFAEQLNLGLPQSWLMSDTNQLSQHVQQEYGDRQFGTIVRWLHEMRRGLTLGGIEFDPTAEIGVAAWSGDVASRPIVSGSAMSPQVFHAVVANAMFYVETASPDILSGLTWLKDENSIERVNLQIGGALPANDPVRAERDDIHNIYVKYVHRVVESIGGIPRRTATNFLGNSVLDVGEISFSALNVLMHRDTGRNKPPDGAADPVWSYFENRLREGTPNIDGGLPIPITSGMRPDGTIGPWRIGFCPDGLMLEAATLREACWVVILAFTGMRAGEAELLPRKDWRTTWYGSDALTTHLVKGARGELLKWWATPTVVRACQILELLAQPDADDLGDSIHRRGSGPIAKNTKGARVLYDLQHFVQHIETDTSIRGFLPINAGWKTNRHYYGRLSAEHAAKANRPSVHPHQFRFTLASLAGLVGLGDVAFQKQAKHASMNVTHAYMTNQSSPQWLNVLVNSEAAERANRAVDFFVDTWTGASELRGPGGRQAQRVIRELLEGLPLAPYDPDSHEPAVEQFMTQVRTLPELLSGLRATATTIHLGDVVHCWRNALKQECTDVASLPMLSLCRPESCQNVIIDSGQQALWRLRLSQVSELLETEDLPTQQRALLLERKGRLQRQLGADDGA